jgi:ATP-dependent helicase/nuclease subunit A
VPLPNDHAQRQRALDPSTSFIVQAPAGSGKTGLLVRRLLTLLAQVQQPEEILAITFTRKATQEMRERVIGSLAKAANGEAFEEHEQDLHSLAAAALERDKELGWNLVENANRLRIMTIDSLCADLVRRMPWSARFGAMPQIEQNPEALYLEAALNCIKQLENKNTDNGAAVTTLLVELEGNLTTLQARLANMLYNRDRWLPLILGKGGADALLEAIAASWQQLIESELASMDGCLSQSTQQSLIALAAYCAANIPEDHRGSAFGQTILTYASISVDTDASSKQKISAKWLAIRSLLITGTALRKPKGLNVRMGLGPASKDKEKQQLIDIINTLEGDEHVINQLVEIASLPDAGFDHTQENLLKAIAALLPTLASELYLLMSERGVADYPQITTQAIDALGNLQQPSDLALTLDAKLEHILMDEFQDTSPHQLRLLERLCAGWQPDDGRSLFLVGDPMQSIYRFRDADVRGFLDVRDHGINDIRPTDLRLDTNFRSAGPLVQWVNQTLPDVLSEQDQPELGAVKFSPSTAFKQTEAGQARCQLVVSSNAADEGKVVAEQVQALAQQVNPDHEIAVLARTRNHLKSVAQALRQSGTEFESIEIELLGDQSCVQDLMAITRLFVHPLDTVAWLSILRAPWCGLTLNDITILRAHNRSKISLWDNDAVLLDLSPDGAARYQRLASVVMPRLASYHGDITNRIRQTWLALSGPACVSKHELDYCDAYFKLLRELVKQGASITAKTLDKAVNQTRVSSPAAQIKLLTLHKAKGLEFDTVFLVGLCGKQKTNEQTPKLLEWDASSYTQAALIAPANYPGKEDKKHTDWIKHRDKQREGLESGRLLYVGVTRAKSALILFGHLKKDTAKPESSSLMHLLWDQLGSEFQQNMIQIAPTDNDNEFDTRPQNFIRRLGLNLPSLDLPQPLRVQSHQTNASTPLEYEWAQDQARMVGIVVHKVMQIRGRENLADWNISGLEHYIKRQLTQLGLVDQDNLEAAGLVTQYVENTQQDAKASWIFNTDHQEIEIEWALSGLIRGQVQHRIIDRSFVDESGTRWVVDFKTSPHKGLDVEHFLDEQQKRYAEQLNDYGILVHGLETDAPIKLGLYFPALKAWREWVFVA